MSQEWSGDLKKMPDKLLSQKVVEAEVALVDYRREEERRKHFTTTERLADRLHALLHSTRAIDCDYHWWCTDPAIKTLDQMLTILEKR